MSEKYFMWTQKVNWTELLHAIQFSDFEKLSRDFRKIRRPPVATGLIFIQTSDDQSGGGETPRLFNQQKLGKAHAMFVQWQ